MSLYSNVLKQAWQIIWHHKYFWWLGILAILFGTSIEIELLESFLNKTKNSFYSISQFLETGIFNSRLLENIKATVATDSYGFIIVISSFIIFLLALLVIVIIAIMSQMVIIDHAAQIKKDINIKPSLKKSLSKNWHRLLSVITLNLSVKIAVYISFLIIALPIFLSINSPSIVADSIYLLLFIIMLPFAIVFSFAVKYIISYIVIYDQRLMQAIRNGWLLFKENWLVSIEMSFILFLINIFASLAVIILISALGIPLGLLGDVGSLTIAPIVFVIVYIVSFFLFLALFLIGGGIITSYSLTAWTNLFLRLNEKGGTSKIARTVNKITKKNQV
ncbi:MAG: hypothetical protein ABIG10_02725 [bacterium]